MERHAFAMKIKKGQMNTYRRKLGEIWPELTALLDRNGITNFSIWNAEDLIFGYYESKESHYREDRGYLHLDLHARTGYAPDVSQLRNRERE